MILLWSNKPLLLNHFILLYKPDGTRIIETIDLRQLALEIHHKIIQSRRTFDEWQDKARHKRLEIEAINIVSELSESNSLSEPASQLVTASSSCSGVSNVPELSKCAGPSQDIVSNSGLSNVHWQAHTSVTGPSQANASIGDCSNDGVTVTLLSIPQPSMGARISGSSSDFNVCTGKHILRLPGHRRVPAAAAAAAVGLSSSYPSLVVSASQPVS